MKQFLNTFLGRHRDFQAGITREQVARTFEQTIQAIHGGIGSVAFKPKGRINAAVFDAVMIGVATRLEEVGDLDSADLKPRYDVLLADKEFIATTDRSTTDQDVVDKRLSMGIEAFRDAN